MKERICYIYLMKETRYNYISLKTHNIFFDDEHNYA
jgi:hypothetical protein